MFWYEWFQGPTVGKQNTNLVIKWAKAWQTYKIICVPQNASDEPAQLATVWSKSLLGALWYNQGLVASLHDQTAQKCRLVQFSLGIHVILFDFFVCSSSNIYPCNFKKSILHKILDQPLILSNVKKSDLQQSKTKLNTAYFFYSMKYGMTFLCFDSSQGTCASCPFDQQQNTLLPITEYLLKCSYFGVQSTTECWHFQQQNADTFNNRMLIFVAYCCWSCQHSVVDRDTKIRPLQFLRQNQICRYQYWLCLKLP